MRMITDTPIKIPSFLFKKRKEREQKINKEKEEKAAKELEKEHLQEKAKEKYEEWLKKKNAEECEKKKKEKVFSLKCSVRIHDFRVYMCQLYCIKSF